MLRRMIVGVGAGLLVAVVIGVPTGIIQTPWYHRMTPVLWWNYPVWMVSSVLVGALAATYVRSSARPLSATEGGQTCVGTVLSLLAVGCPVCNKLVVAAVGMSGALSWFAPLQPILAVASLGLLGYALRARQRTAIVCGASPQPGGG